jgi:exodeoxyribonuclease VII large subunit
MATLPSADERILSVGELARALKETLQEAFPAVWVKGEISGFKHYESGHMYFSLKDGTPALVQAVMWRNSVPKLTFTPRDGTEVEAFGEIDFYGPNGKCQLIVRSMRPAGIGALLVQFEELKRRLAAEGLFDAARKQPLPPYPLRIGLVTSPIGAAVRDMVKVLRGRWPGIGIVLAPVKVQGAGAAQEIAAAIERFNRHGGVDLLIVGRGGGSLEDLWAFNEEPVVRAIAASALPVISAVGHEVDTTLADLAADVRAATPSNAAEIAVRDAAELRRRVVAVSERALRDLRRGVADRRAVLEGLQQKYGFRRVRDVFGTMQQRIDGARDRADAAVRTCVAGARLRADALVRAWALRDFPSRVTELRGDAAGLARRLQGATVENVLRERRRAESLHRQLVALSPRAVLERGYTLARGADGKLLRGPDALAAGDVVTIEFARGEAETVVRTVRRGGTHGEEDRRG